MGLDFLILFWSWNNGAFNNENNIQLTLVQEDNNNYSVHIYPTVQREFVQTNLQRIVKEFDKKVNAGKELGIHVAQMSFCQGLSAFSKLCVQLPSQ